MSNPRENPDLNRPPGEPSAQPTAPTGPGASAELQRMTSLYQNTALSLVFICPVLALLPPRKFDLYTFGLGVVFFASAGVVTEQHTGKSLLWHIGSRIPSRANRERREEARWRALLEEGSFSEAEESRRRLVEMREKGKKRGFIRSAWMGGEPDDWVEQRKKREERALEGGRGYGGLIMDQLREVWTGKKSDDDGDEGEDEDEPPDKPHGNKSK